MGSFFGTLKTESLPHYCFRTRAQARRIIFEYIEVFYNRIRRHETINNQRHAYFAIKYAIKHKIVRSCTMLARPLIQTQHVMTMSFFCNKFII